DCRRDGETVISLEPLNRTASHWAQDAVNRSLVIALLGQPLLYFRCHIARCDIAIPVDRPVIDIIAVIGVIAVGGIPPAIVPEPVAATVEHNWEALRTPPATIMALMPIPLTGSAEGCVVATSDYRKSAIHASVYDNVV